MEEQDLPARPPIPVPGGWGHETESGEEDPDGDDPEPDNPLLAMLQQLEEEEELAEQGDGGIEEEWSEEASQGLRRQVEQAKQRYPQMQQLLVDMEQEIEQELTESMERLSAQPVRQLEEPGVRRPVALHRRCCSDQLSVVDGPVYTTACTVAPLCPLRMITSPSDHLLVMVWLP